MNRPFKPVSPTGSTTAHRRICANLARALVARPRPWILGVAALTATLFACPPTDGNPDGGDASLAPEPGREDGGTAYGFCPTAIDVYGGLNAVLSGCGGEDAPIDAGLAGAGLNEPGDAGYDQTLAGRLRARLLADSELTARFGTAWTVRSCAREGTMSSYARLPLQTECSNPPNTGDFVPLCADAPAPLVLFDATNFGDRCHGGGADSTNEDDPEAFADHWRSYFDQFLSAKDAGFVLVSPQAAWRPAGTLARNDCQGARSAWSPQGGVRWRQLNPDARGVRRIGELQHTFQVHHPCCASLDAGCAEDWFPQDAGAGLDGWSRFDCRGADALVELWYAELRGYLLENQFACP